MGFIKNIFSIGLVAILSIGCSQKNSSNRLNNWMGDNGKIKILSTTGQIGDLVSSIGGERVDAITLITGELDPHSYELVKGDGEKLARADVVFYNGLGLEHGASLSTQLRSSSNAIAVGEKVKFGHPEKILYKEGVLDPHIWMDISLWEKAVPHILEKLIELDPEGEAYYKERAFELIQELEKTHLYVKNLLFRVPSDKRYLVTSHDAFRYFTKEYLADPGDSNWSERFAAPEGLAPDGQLSPADIQNIIGFLRLHQITTLFPESNVSRDSVIKIVTAGNELGLHLKLCRKPLYGDSLCGLSYMEMMRRNAEVISEHLLEVH